MKNIKKLYWKISAFFMLMLGLLTTTVSAATGGESVTVFGLAGTIFGWLLLVAGLVFVYILWKSKKSAKNLQVLFAILAVSSFVLGGYLAVYDTTEAPSEASIATTTILWDVGVPTIDAGNATVSGNTITVRCGVNTTENILTYPDASTLNDAVQMANPVVNWTIAPRDTAEFTTETITANDECTVAYSDKITIAGTEYNFFDLTTGIPTYKQLNWTFNAPATTDFETIPVSVVVGEVGWVSLEINYNQALNNMAVWDSHAFTATICGETYNIVLTNVADVTA